MSYNCICHTIAFGGAEDVSRFASMAGDVIEELGFGGHVAQSQQNGCHYAKFSKNVLEGTDFEFWDRIIPQFQKLRFLLSRTSERDWYLTGIVRHRHEQHGFNLCLQDHTTQQTIGEFPSDKNPISVLEDFRDEVLRDRDLRHALNLLGYPVEMLVECSVSELP